jgi:hypothetical protein
MKKLLLPFILLVTIAPVAKSQVLIALVFGDKLNSPKTEFGLNVGVNYSSLTNLDNAKYSTGFGIGMYFTWKFHDRWQLQPELFFRFPTGATKLPPYEFLDSTLTRLTSSSTVTRLSRSFSIPVNLKFRAWKQLRFSVAPQVLYLTKNDDIFRKTLDNNDEVSYRTESKSGLTRFDFGLNVGVSYKLKQGKGMNLEARYYLGFVDTDTKDMPGMNANRSFSLYLGIPIGSEKNVQTSLDDE